MVATVGGLGIDDGWYKVNRWHVLLTVAECIVAVLM